VHTQINVSTSEEVFSSIKSFFFFFSRSGTTADGNMQQQNKIGKKARS
jgi:hypothetical protein